MEVFLFKSKPVMNICHPSIHTPVLCFIFHVYRHRIKAEYAQVFWGFFSFIIALVLIVTDFIIGTAWGPTALHKSWFPDTAGNMAACESPCSDSAGLLQNCNVSHMRLHRKGLARRVWNGTIPKDWSMSRELHLQRGVYCWLFTRRKESLFMCVSLAIF